MAAAVDERRARIYDDLRGMIDGELYFEPLDRAPYAHDASLYEIDPLGVVVPRTEDDVVTIVRYAAEHGLAIHPRGAGTDTGGGSLGPGLVLDLGRHLRRIIAIEPEHVVVEAGVVPDQLNAQLATVGRRLEPMPWDGDVTTIGGMIAVDAAGGRSMRYGSTGDQVERLRVVVRRGRRGRPGIRAVAGVRVGAAGAQGADRSQAPDAISPGSRRVQNARSAAPRTGPATRWTGPPTSAGIHLGRLIAGSEGTLAMVTQAVLRTVPLAGGPGGRSCCRSGGLAHAAAFAPELLGSKAAPCSCDLLDRRSLRLARDAEPLFRGAIDDAAESVLVVEFEASRSARGLGAGPPGDREGRPHGLDGLGARGRLEAGGMRADPGLAAAGRAAVDAVSRTGPAGLRLRRHRGAAGPARARPRSPPAALPGRERHLDPRRLCRRGTPSTPAVPGPVAPGRPRGAGAAGDAGLRHRAGCGRDDLRLPACGLSRTQFLRKQFGDVVQVFREIKDAFDPMGQLNPGKVIGDDPHLMIRNLREFPACETGPRRSRWPRPPGDRPGGCRRATAWRRPQCRAEAGKRVGETHPGPIGRSSPALIWPELQMLEMASACHGCGSCRTIDPALRMCPSFRASRMEAASPRAQANLIRQVATGAVDPRLWGSDEMKAHADLCIHCKLCRRNAPRAWTSRA